MQRIFSVKFSADANFVLSGSDDTNIRIWKAEASKKLSKVRCAQAVPTIEPPVTASHVFAALKLLTWRATLTVTVTGLTSSTFAWLDGSARAPQDGVQRVAQGALPAPARDQPHLQAPARAQGHQEGGRGQARGQRARAEEDGEPPRPRQGGRRAAHQHPRKGRRARNGVERRRKPGGRFHQAGANRSSLPPTQTERRRGGARQPRTVSVINYMRVPFRIPPAPIAGMQPLERDLEVQCKIVLRGVKTSLKAYSDRQIWAERTRGKTRRSAASLKQAPLEAPGSHNAIRFKPRRKKQETEKDGVLPAALVDAGRAGAALLSVHDVVPGDHGRLLPGAPALAGQGWLRDRRPRGARAGDPGRGAVRPGLLPADGHGDAGAGAGGRDQRDPGRAGPDGEPPGAALQAQREDARAALQLGRGRRDLQHDGQSRQGQELFQAAGRASAEEEQFPRQEEHALVAAPAPLGEVEPPTRRPGF
ncbi:hypothetical protein ON010_g1333 [Phytophthora cinnamomi]|nr:hypothetical protein ON010_g1333 [Phytophthora cinnamomi]